jgi:hypothetical protein
MWEERGTTGGRGSVRMTAVVTIKVHYIQL